VSVRPPECWHVQICLLIEAFSHSRMTHVQMDRFIPNRSASNLDSSQYNIALEMRDVENTQQNVASSPSKVCAHDLAH
jgi:hypothetical protein